MKNVKLLLVTAGMIEDHSDRRLTPLSAPMPRALAPPRALDHATHSVDRGHGSIDPTRISVTDRRVHFDRLDRVLVLRPRRRSPRQRTDALHRARLGLAT
jgi:hypothetical protein